MAIARNHPPYSLGLGGDGDEIAAIEEVERRFGVQLDYADAHSWTTAGDVFAALQKAMPADQSSAPDTWADFAEAISLETEVDPSLITPDTLLLGQRRFDRRLMMVVASAIGIAVALIRLR